MPNNEQILKQAIDYQIEVSKWVKDVFKWHKENGDVVAQGNDGPGGGTNPPPPPPPPPPSN